MSTDVPSKCGKRLRNFRRKVIRLALVVLSSLTIGLGACSQSGGNDLQLKSPGTGGKDVSVKSSYAFGVTKTFTDATGKMSTAASYRVYTANYDLDWANFAQTLDKPLKSDDDVRIIFSLVGEQGSNEKSSVKAGTYSAKADKFMKVEDVSIISRKGGADNKVVLDRNMLSGGVKVTSASDDSVSGDIDLSAGDTAIKGSFTARILKRK